MSKPYLPTGHTSLLAFAISLFCLVNVSLRAQAPVQTIEPTYVSIADGLVSPTVNAVIQDSYGIIWIGTNQGLQRYDGYNFQTFKNVPGKPTSLQHNLIWSLLEDANHDIWVSNGKGVSKYIRQKNEFKNYEFAPAFNFTFSSQIAGFKLFMDSQKNLWVNSFNLQLLQYNATSDEWEMAKYELVNAEEPDQINGPAFALAEDLSGNLWLGTLSYGLMRKAKSENVFKPLSFENIGGINFENSENVITALYADSTNTLWITTRSGVYKFNPYTGTFKTLIEYMPRPGENWNNWNSILPDPLGNIWIANNFRGPLKFDGISERFTEIEIAGKVIMRTHGWNITFTQFMIDRSGIFWFGSRESGLVKYDPVNKPFQYLAHDENNPKSMSSGGAFGILASQVKPGITYVGTRGGGVNIYDPNKQTFEKITFNVVDDMFGGSARSIAEDTDGSLWLGTWGDGLVELDKNYKEVKRYKYDSTNANTISNNQVRVIKPDSKGKLWIGTNSGLNILDTKTNTLQRVASRQFRQYPTQLVHELEKLISTDQKVSAIEKVTDNQNISIPIEIKTSGNYWVMTVGEIFGLERADFGWIQNEAKDTVWLMGDFDTFHAGGNFKNRIEISSITLQPGKYTLNYHSDDSHSYDKWNEAPPTQTSLYGIALIKSQGENQFQSFQTPVVPEEEELVIDGVNITDIEITDKFVWVGTAGRGLNRIDPTTNSVKNYYNNSNDNNSLSHNSILDIQQDSQGMIWLATPEGINKFNPTTETFIRYTEMDGLPTNLTEGIVEGEAGEMWIASQNGLSQMVINENLNKATFINYNSTDGLGTDVFLSLTNTRATDGRFYFGGEHGLTTFSSITSNKTPPAIIISNLFISNKSVLDMKENSPLTESLLNTKSISLPFDQNSLSFEFAALHYANPKKNQYAHMLKGYDQDWIYDNRNFAAYTNLDPGKYEFRVRAANAYGIWNEGGLTLEITILPPWWRTWWAYVSYVVVFGVFAYTTDRTIRTGIKRRERERGRERELKQAKEIEKAYTELKATQTQLIQSEKMASLGELTAGIAHEIQNPLNFVNNFSEVNAELIDELEQELNKGNLEEVKALAKDIKENEQKISHHGKRAGDIVKGMLQHSRSSTGQKEKTDINALCDEYLRLSYHGLRAKDKTFNASFKTELDKNVPLVSVIPQDLGRVILNLINNAFYAVNARSKKGEPGYVPTVSITTQLTAKSQLLIVIKDNGDGIPSEILNKIFQPFFTTKPTGEGTGLGLSLSYDIITKGHNGTLNAETKPGVGTDFIIELPT